MKNLLKNGIFGFLICISGISMAQCPGVTPEGLSFPPLGFDFTIDITNQTCTENGSIDVTLNEPLPSNIIVIRSLPGEFGFSVVPESDIDIAAALPGTYTYGILNIETASGDFCQFDILENACPGDFNGDGFITIADLTGFFSEFNTDCADCCGDFNSDGVVNVSDLTTFLSLFGESCGGTLAPIPQPESQERNKEQLDALLQKYAIPEMKIFPNPASGSLNITLDNIVLNAENSTVVIMDVSGRIIENVSFNYTDSQITTNIGALAEGTYYALITTEEGSYTESFIVK